MNKSNNKGVLILVLGGLGLFVGIIPVVDFMLATSTDNQSHIPAFKWFDEINFFHWGWLIGLTFAVISLAGTAFWKPGTRLFRIFITILNVITVLLSAHWLFWVIATLNLPT